MEIKDMTDAELVEAVAREVLGFVTGNIDKAHRFVRYSELCGRLKMIFNPFTDLNDLFMVLEKLREMKWAVEIFILTTGECDVKLIKPNPFDAIRRMADNLPRAVLEAALAAERSEK